MIHDAFGSLVRALFWPAFVLSLVLAGAWRALPPGRPRTTLQILGALLLFAPHLAVLVYMNRSLDLVLYQEGVLVFWFAGVALLALVGPALRRGGRLSRPSPRPFVRVILCVVFGAATIYFGAQFFCDLLMPAVVVEGHITGRGSQRGTRGPRSYWLTIDGQRYATTRDVWQSLQPNELVRAEVAAGSGTILSLERP